jgi:polyphosphate kinase 2 (PPK2 family)
VQQAYLGTLHRAIIVLEGWDTADKGGVVRRLGWALDPRGFKVHAIAVLRGFSYRGRWKDYEAAIEDMIETTSTKRAPWYLVPANDKPFGRLAAFRIIADRLSKGVDLEPRALEPQVAEAAEQLFGLKLPPRGYRGH